MKYLFIIFFTFFFSISSHCQKEKTKVTIGISENNIITGYLIAESKDSITINAEDIGVISLNKKDVAFINIKGKNSSSSKINSSRLKMYRTDYGVSDNAIPLDKGSVYWDSKLLYFNKVSFTPIKNLTLEAGTLIPSAIFNSPYISIKYSHSLSQNIHIGAKSLYFGVGTADYKTFNTSLYSTIGNLKNNITLGFHRSNNRQQDYDFTINNYVESKDNYNLLSIAAMTEITELLDIRFEYISPIGFNKLMTIQFGLNFKKMALTFGAFGSIDSKYSFNDGTTFIPVLTAKIPMVTPKI